MAWKREGPPRRHPCRKLPWMSGLARAAAGGVCNEESRSGWSTGPSGEGLTDVEDARASSTPSTIALTASSAASRVSVATTAIFSPTKRTRSLSAAAYPSCPADQLRREIGCVNTARTPGTFRAAETSRDVMRAG